MRKRKQVRMIDVDHNATTVVCNRLARGIFLGTNLHPESRRGTEEVSSGWNGIMPVKIDCRVVAIQAKMAW